MANAAVVPVPWIMDTNVQGQYECPDCGHIRRVFATCKDELPDDIDCAICGREDDAHWYLRDE